MKIAIPVNEDKKTVCASFGRAPFFAVADTETNQTEYISNSAQSSQGGAGIKSAQALIDHKINVLLTPRCGENAIEVLKAADIPVYSTTSILTEDNIKAFNEGGLTPLTSFHKGFHGHGHGGR